MGTDLSGKSVALVVSRFYPRLAEELVRGATRRFLELGGKQENLHQFSVPGSFEIPQAARKLVAAERFDAVVCLGVVIRGATAHFDYVCENVSRGVGEIARRADIPVIFGVLTTEDRAQAEERLGGSQGHKGEEALQAALEMIATLERIPTTEASRN